VDGNEACPVSAGTYEYEYETNTKYEDEAKTTTFAVIGEELERAGWTKSQREAARKNPQHALAWVRHAATAIGVRNPAAWSYERFKSGMWPAPSGPHLWPGQATALAYQGTSPQAPQPVATLTAEQRAYTWARESGWRQQPDDLAALLLDWRGVATVAIPSIAEVARATREQHDEADRRATPEHTTHTSHLEDENAHG